MKRSEWHYESIYSAMGKNRRTSDLEHEIRSHQIAFWLILAAWIGSALWFAHHLYWLWRSAVITEQPLLSGAPQFTLLALIIGLSAYLRQVRSHAVEQRDEIAKGSRWNYPLEQPYWAFTQKKLKLLDNISLYLTLASPLLILLFVVLAFRAFFEAVNHVNPYAHATLILSVMDVVTLLWSAVAFVFLAITHFGSRVRDDRLRAISRAWEPEMRALQEEKNGRQTIDRPKPPDHMSDADHGDAK